MSTGAGANFRQVTATPTIVERAAADAACREALERALAGQGGVVFVTGEAGLGKSTVLSRARASAEQMGFGIAGARGDAMENSLPFGFLMQAFHAEGGLDLGEREADESPDARASRFYEALKWLERSSVAPLLLALDDAHWADADSLSLLSFLSRRVGSLPVAVIATLRPWPVAAADVAGSLVHEGFARTVQLEPLSEAGAASLLAARTGQALPPPDVARAWSLCSGNPLLLEQVAAAVTRGEHIPTRLGADAERHSNALLVSRFAGLSVAGMRFARAGSVFGTRFRVELARLLGGVDDHEADVTLDALDRGGLVRQSDGGAVEFAHPLFAQALYDDLGDAVRVRLHARAFSLLAGVGLEEEAAEHAIKAELVGDGNAVALLERVGRRARRAGAYASAIRILKAASALAGESAHPGLLLELAGVLGGGGKPREAVGVCERLLSMPDLSPMERAKSLRVLASSLTYLGSYDRGARRFEECVDIAAELDPPFAVKSLLTYAWLSWLLVGPCEALAITSRARTLSAACADGIRSRAEAAWGLMSLESGDPRGIELTQIASRTVESDPSLQARDVSSSWGALVTYGSVAKLVERPDDSERAYRTALGVAEPLGIAEEVAFAAVACADVLIRQLRLDEALELIGRTAPLAELALLWEPFSGVGRALVLLVAGRIEESDACWRAAEPVVRTIGLWSGALWLRYIRGWRLLWEGRLAEACGVYEEMEAIATRAGVSEPCCVPWAGHAIASYVARGREADARRLIDWLDDGSERLPCLWPRIAATTGRARLAEAADHRDEADALWRASLDLHRAGNLPLERVQTLLEYGKFLRRSGQPASARPILAAAIELAEGGGAVWLAAQAHEELKVAGGRRRRRRDEPNGLTPQERRVAELAAAGATNPEIARRLYVSVRTVETHLERVFTKLDVRSRRELANPGLLSGELPRPR